MRVATFKMHGSCRDRRDRSHTHTNKQGGFHRQCCRWVPGGCRNADGRKLGFCGLRALYLPTIFRKTMTNPPRSLIKDLTRRERILHANQTRHISILRTP